MNASRTWSQLPEIITSQCQHLLQFWFTGLVSRNTTVLFCHREGWTAFQKNANQSDLLPRTLLSNYPLTVPVWEWTTKATGILFWEVFCIWTLNLLQTLKMLTELLSSLLLNTYNELLKKLCLDIQCILLGLWHQVAKYTAQCSP